MRNNTYRAAQRTVSCAIAGRRTITAFSMSLSRVLAATIVFKPFSVLGAFLVLVVSLSITLSVVSPAYAVSGSENLVDPTQAADNSFIYDTTVASLYSQASLYNDKTVQVVGEVIGDRIKASNNQCWITLTETVATDVESISVIMSFEQSEQIDHYGRYGVRGSTMQVRGTYHQACDEHDGLPDIHVTNSSVLSRGQDIPDEVNYGEVFIGIGLVVIGIVLMCGFYIARERTR